MCVLIVIHDCNRTTIDRRTPCNDGTEHVGLSPTRQTDIACTKQGRSAVRCLASRVKRELDRCCEVDFLGRRDDTCHPGLLRKTVVGP